MSDTNDPFAARPYVPPAARTDSDDTVETPAYVPVTPQPPVESAAEAPTEHAVEGSQSPQTEQFTHRYGEDTAGAGTSTQQLPPFASPPPPASTLPPQNGGPSEPPARKKPGRYIAAAAAIIVLGAASGVGGAYAYVHSTDSAPVVNSLNTGKPTGGLATGAVEKVAQTVLPSVVQINVHGSSQSGSGTGIIISSDGEILTNNHVVESAATNGTITVSFNDGTISHAKILGRDKVTDLAVIKATNKTGLTPAVLGNSSELRVGQEVVAIGSPFGLESTVTSGIISALNRPVSSSDGSGAAGSVFPAVQTDAAINPGNSGGPLVDLAGHVIAINSAIRTNGADSSTAQSGSIGLGFAIPIDLAKNVSKHLVKGEKVEHARIGITVGSAVDKDGITTTGALVNKVSQGSAGDKAGIKVNDVITAINGIPVASSDGLVAAIRGYQPGQDVTLTILRGGNKQDVKVTLDSDGGTLGS